MRTTTSATRVTARALATVTSAAIFLAAWPATAGSLTIGSVEEDVKAEQAIFQPLRAYLRAELEANGVGEVNLVVHTSIKDIAAGFDRGEIDLYIDSPVLVAMVARVSNARPFLRSWKEGVAEYRSVVYVRDDSPVTEVADLRGRVIAFKKQESTPGYFMPRGLFLGADVPMVPLEAASDPVPDDQVGYVFSHGDKTTLGWVMTDRVAAGVMKEDDVASKELRRVRQQIRIVGVTAPMPRQALAVRDDLDPTLVAALYDTLTTMHLSPPGAAALETLDETARFDEFPGGVDAAFAPIGRLLDVLDVTIEPTS